MTQKKKKTSVAPMMEWTDHHYRTLARLISKHTWLYTEMLAAETIVYQKDNLRLKEVSYTKIVRWIQRARLDVDKKRSLVAVLFALVYWIWRLRNRRYWHQESVNSEEIVSNVKRGIHFRFVALGVKKGYVVFYFVCSSPYKELIGVTLFFFNEVADSPKKKS